MEATGLILHNKICGELFIMANGFSSGKFTAACHTFLSKKQKSIPPPERIRVATHSRPTGECDKIDDVTHIPDFAYGRNLYKLPGRFRRMIIISVGAAYLLLLLDMFSVSKEWVMLVVVAEDRLMGQWNGLWDKELLLVHCTYIEAGQIPKQ